MFFSKSEEEKNKEIINSQKKFLEAYKILLNSDTVIVFNSLIRDFINIFSSYNNETISKNYLFQELKPLINNLINKNELDFNYSLNNAKYYFHTKNINNILEHLNIKLEDSETLGISLENFTTIIEDNINALIDEQNLTIKYFEMVKDINDFNTKTSFTIMYLMSITLLIVEIYSKILNYQFIIQAENKEQIKDILEIIENISNENLESKEIIENIANIDTQLFKNCLTKLDIYIYILLIRENIIVKNYKSFLDKDMHKSTDIFIQNIQKLELNSNTIENIKEERKKYIENFIPQSFVRTDKYLMYFFDYHICIILLNKNLITMDKALEYTIKGFITNEYDKTFSYKKALWDFDRYINKDFSLEIQSFDLLQKYHNVKNGYEFEDFCFTLYSNLGYYVEHTKLSNDQGADLIIEKDGIRTVVQAKFYSMPVGNKAVQEVVASKAFYQNTQQAIVITNSTFTKSAIKLADANGVQLVNGDDIENYIQSILNKV